MPVSPDPVLPVLLAFSTVGLVGARPLSPEPVLPVWVPGACSALALVETSPLLLDVLPVLVPVALSALTSVEATPPPALLLPVLAPGALRTSPVVVTSGALDPSPVCVAMLAAGLAGLWPPTMIWALGSGLTLAVTPWAPPTLMVRLRVANAGSTFLAAAWVFTLSLPLCGTALPL